MTASRWSIDNALRQARGARGAIGRATIKYGTDALLVAELRRARALLDAVEARLLAARTRAVAARARRRRAA